MGPVQANGTDGGEGLVKHPPSQPGLRGVGEDGAQDSVRVRGGRDLLWDVRDNSPQTQQSSRLQALDCEPRSDPGTGQA